MTEPLQEAGKRRIRSPILDAWYAALSVTVKRVTEHAWGMKSDKDAPPVLGSLTRPENGLYPSAMKSDLQAMTGLAGKSTTRGNPTPSWDACKTGMKMNLVETTRQKKWCTDMVVVVVVVAAAVAPGERNGHVLATRHYPQAKVAGQLKYQLGITNEMIMMVDY